jgi:hypothetical protein
MTDGSDFDIDPESGLPCFRWKNQLRYRCPRTWESGAACEYDTYDLAEMRKHIAAPHTQSGKAPKRNDPQPAPVLYDGEGKPLRPSTAVPPEFRGLRFKD